MQRSHRRAPPPTVPGQRHRGRAQILILALAAAAGFLAFSWNGHLVVGRSDHRSLSAAGPGWFTPALASKGGNGNGNSGNGNGNGGGTGSNGAGNGNGNSGNGNGNGGGNGSNGAGNGNGNSGNGNGNGGGTGSSNGNEGGNGNGSGPAANGSSGTGQSTSSQSRAGAAATAGPAGERFIGDEVLLIDTPPGAIDKARSIGFDLIETRRLASLGLSTARLRTPRRVSPRAAVALLEAAIPGLTADVNTLYTPFQPQSAQVISLPAPDYARRMIGWPVDEGCGRGYRIGMIDTEVADSQPLLAGRRLHQRSFIPAGATPDVGNHGTVIASLLVGGRASGGVGTAGLLPAADLYAANVVEHDGNEEQATALAMAQALDWMVAEHVPLVNVSLSGGPNKLLEIAVRRAAERSTVIIAAAGNEGPEAAPAYPGAYPQAIAITAVDDDRQIFPGANHGNYIAFAAPGVSIWAPDGKGSGQFVTGTSFAAPFAAGAAVLEMMTGVPAQTDKLRQALADDAVHLGPAGRNAIFGYGLVQVTTACAAGDMTTAE